MIDKSSPGSGSNRFYWIAALAVTLFLLAVFLLFNMRQPAASQQAALSLDQAMTMVAQVTETAYAANPHPAASSTSKVALNKPAPTIRQAANKTALVPAISKATTKAAASTSGPSPTYMFQPADNQPVPQEQQPTYPVANITVRPSFTPKPTGTKNPTAIPTVTRTPKPTANPGLPGLTINDITSRLTSERGFTCTQESSDQVLTLWMCDYQSGYDVWYHVDIYGTPGMPVSNLMASVFQAMPNDDKAADILGYIASLPYSGSNPSAARQWVAQTLPSIASLEDIREKTFGKVRLRLYGTPQGRYLEMGT